MKVGDTDEGTNWLLKDKAGFNLSFYYQIKEVYPWINAVMKKSLWSAAYSSPIYNDCDLRDITNFAGVTETSFPIKKAKNEQKWQVSGQ